VSIIFIPVKCTLYITSKSLPTMTLMESVDNIIAEFSSLAWGYPLLLLLIGGGLYLLIRIKVLPFRYLSHALALLSGRYNEESSEGEISHFKALSTALASTIGMGNIAGVAVAISIGGPGAIFWMWVSGLIGMCTKFFTCSLSIMYRGRDTDGKIQGGPMYFITEGLGRPWKPMAIFFCLAGLIGALPVFNVNQLTQAIRDILLVPNGMYSSGSSEIYIGVILLVITSVVILGGLQRIASTASRLVPFMVVIYFISVLVILAANISEVPRFIALIFTDAFQGAYVDSDSLTGGALGALIILGIRRGAFSNEAGIGTAPMAHGASKTSEPIREGLVAMLGPFIDTIIVCTLTAFAILVTGVWEMSESNGVTLTAEAFGSSIPGVGKYLLLICIAVFSISSLFSFSYYGTKCTSFLFGADNAKYYNIFYLLSILIGATTTLDMMINLIDGFYALMAIPTMVATLILAPRVVERAREYFAKIA